MFPIGWANLPVVFEELEGLDHSQSFVDRATQGQIVDDLVPDGAIFVDQEQATQGYGVVEKDVVISRDLFIQVGDQRVFDWADTPLVSGHVLQAR